MLTLPDDLTKNNEERVHNFNAIVKFTVTIPENFSGNPKELKCNVVNSFIWNDMNPPKKKPSKKNPVQLKPSVQEERVYED